MTEKTYLSDMDRLTMSAMVIAVEEVGPRSCVRLNRTIFHPQGGGQRPDIGFIGAMEVVDVQHAKEDIDHYVEGKLCVVVGDTVTLQVDGGRRLTASRHHTAGHLIAGLLEQEYPGCKVTRGHHYEGEARVEMEGALPEPEQVKLRLPNVLAEVIAANPPVTVLASASGERIVAVGDYCVPCGGTHVSLSQLGQVNITNARIKQGRLRVSYEVIS